MRIRKRLSATLLAFVMAVSVVGSTPAAAGGGITHIHDGTCGYSDEIPCSHRVHDENCGYEEAAEGSACDHEHDESCYRQVTDCQHIHTAECYEDALDASPSNTAEPENCPHICDEENGCITKELACQHVHSVECGYEAGNDGQPCRHELGEHDDTCGYVPARPCVYQDGAEQIEFPRLLSDPPVQAEHCNCATPCTESSINANCLVCGGTTGDEVYSVCAARVIGIQSMIFPDGDILGAGYRHEDLGKITVSATGAAAVRATDYPAAITIEESVPSQYPAGSYSLAGIVRRGADDSMTVEEAVEIPAFPSAGTDAEKDEWNAEWGDGVLVAYVPQEPNPSPFSSLEPGETYWFDLSEAEIRGMVTWNYMLNGRGGSPRPLPPLGALYLYRGD